MRGGLLILSSALLVMLALVAVPIAVAPTGAAGAARPPRATSESLIPAHVRPAAGGPRSAFTVRLRIPTQTGTFGQFRRMDSLAVTGPRHKGCASNMEMGLPAAAAGSTVRVRLVPGRPGGHWCTGTFHGVITETQSIVCGGTPARACPMLMTAPRTLARFRFRVRRG